MTTTAEALAFFGSDVPTAEQVTAYLTAHGWQLVGWYNRLNLWGRADTSERVSVPTFNWHWPGHAERIVATLARYERRPMTDVASSLRSTR